MGPFSAGAPVTISTTVKVAGVLTNPTGITLQARYPDGTAVPGVPSPTNDGTGLYHVDLSALLLNQTGRYRFAWVTTGTAAGVQAGGFDVLDPFGAAHISLDEVYEHLELTGANLSDVKVAELQRMLASAVSDQEQWVGPVAARTVTETVTAHCGQLWLSSRPVLAVVGATVSGVAQVTTAWRVGLPMAGDVSRTDGVVLSGTFDVTYTAGRNPIPPDLQEAALLRVQHSYESQRGPGEAAFGEASDGGIGGSPFRLLLQAQDKEKPYVLPSVA